MPYQIESTPGAARDLADIAKSNRAAALQIKAAVMALAEDPYPPGAKKLSGKDFGLYRLRTGDFRIIYRVEEEAILVLLVKIGDRKDVYRYLKRLK